MKKIVYIAAVALSSVLLFSGNLSAETGKSDVLWFAQLVQAHNEKDFCAPSNTTLGAMAASLVRYSHAHPELQDHFNDQTALRALAESYPCSRGSMAPIPMGSINKYVGPNGNIKEIVPMESEHTTEDR